MNYSETAALERSKARNQIKACQQKVLLEVRICKTAQIYFNYSLLYEFFFFSFYF